MKPNLRLLYLYLFSFVGLLIVVIASIQLVNLTLKTLVFTDVDTYEIYPPLPDDKGRVSESTEMMQARQERETRRQRQRELTNTIAMLTVGTPLYLYHWGLIKKESVKE